MLACVCVCVCGCLWLYVYCCVCMLWLVCLPQCRPQYVRLSACAFVAAGFTHRASPAAPQNNAPSTGASEQLTADAREAHSAMLDTWREAVATEEERAAVEEAARIKLEKKLKKKNKKKKKKK